MRSRGGLGIGSDLRLWLQRAAAEGVGLPLGRCQAPFHQNTFWVGGHLRNVSTCGTKTWSTSAHDGTVWVPVDAQRVRTAETRITQLAKETLVRRKLHGISRVKSQKFRWVEVYFDGISFCYSRLFFHCFWMFTIFDEVTACLPYFHPFSPQARIVVFQRLQRGATEASHG